VIIWVEEKESIGLTVVDIVAGMLELTLMAVEDELPIEFVLEREAEVKDPEAEISGDTDVPVLEEDVDDKLLLV